MNRKQSKSLVCVCISLLVAALLPAQRGNADFTTKGGQAYIAECATAGVPIPPKWGNFGPSAWQDNGSLDADENFLVLSLIATGRSTNAPNAQVFYYESANPKGICIALPRTTNEGSVESFGIICQGDNGKACFWDNSTFTLGSIYESKPLLAFNGGADLVGKRGGVCTTCHTGENVFIVHPGTALDLTANGINMKPREYAQPIVHESWPQNSRPNTIHGECGGCHNQFNAGRLPQISTAIQPAPTSWDQQPLGYCRTLLLPVYAKTMPQGVPDMSNPPPEYAFHWTSMLAACDDPPPPLQPMSSPEYRPGIGWAIITTLAD